MHFRTVLFIIILVGIISTAEFASIMISASPYTASKAVLWAFFLSFAIALTAWGSIIWFGVRRLWLRRPTTNLLICARQAALCSMIISLSFFFKSLSIFSLWDIAPLAIAALLIEFFFQAEKKPQATLEYDPNS